MEEDRPCSKKIMLIRLTPNDTTGYSQGPSTLAKGQAMRSTG